MSSRSLGGAVVVAVALLGSVSGSRGEDRVTVRGVYFREHSTRVVQPMAQVSKDLPHGLEVGTHFLVDAITSASVAAGTLTDSIFTEFRKEAGVSLAKTWDRTRVRAGYRYSREPDYISQTFGLSVEQGVWENSGTVALALAYTADTISPTLSESLDVIFGSIAYTQALSPTTVAQVGYERALFDGFLANPYLRHPSLGRENLPTRRLRHVAVARVARYVPSLASGLQLHYRFYLDQMPGEPDEPWGLMAHTIETRVYKEIGRYLEVRVAYRFHTQGQAEFWCNIDATRGGVPGCYGMSPRFHSVDAKLGALATHVPELKLTWEARRLRGWPVLGWFAEGAFDVSYGRYIQNTPYGGAHLLQTGYSLPF